MSIQFQNQNKIRVLITGGNGDIAQKLSELLDYAIYETHLPQKNELDVRSKSSVEEYFHKQGDKFDIVVNAAGTLYSAHVVGSDPDRWINDINVNLIGTYLVSKYALESNPSCKIINVSSTAGFNSYKDWTSYCAAKAGVLRLSGGLYKDSFDVITACPGAIQTKIRKNINIENPNVMTLEEGVMPILDIVKGSYESGDIVFYRKGQLKVIKQDELSF
ncbi:SDR family oxidoreductase [Vibrio parahaemolyticus]|uniref:SDR family oxidoreductase n=2 Tax=Vibrio parahaemolyticus TaxID=670 RepID=UPI00084B8B40|nr:SDR family oxidoreductase [Vibrio parahaemolyticus]PWF69889.1 NAD(P)-dependent oxidoreductase [Vibrio sp. T21]EGR0621382.1 SDR family oxidoreductase [Vibrio parahaemolyticus]EHK9085864.1 SDR family oxidoreductase [Vibrio parahaemolyticus]EHU4838725.1 SDR family oxidoreductase [Vibrio parahaemolyticus]EHU5159576.1 SDR family oxidoreductase [Vibrio parahaemolyticus]